MALRALSIVERSNVDLIQARRAFEINSKKSLEVANRILRIVNNIGKKA